MSDGEHDERKHLGGNNAGWENKLRNLIAVVDRNNIQIDGFTEDIMRLSCWQINGEPSIGM